MVSAFLYALSALAIKRSIELGIGPWRMTFLSNAMMAVLFGPFVFFGHGPLTFTPWWPPVLFGFLFFIGQVLTFLSLTRGDVSIVTPILGSKVVLVAVFLVVLLHEKLRASVWVAAILTTAGIALLQQGNHQAHRGRILRTVLLSIATSCCFALVDIITKYWCPLIGFFRMLPASFLVTFLLSFALLPFFRKPLIHLPEKSGKVLLLAIILLALQSVGMAIAIGYYGDAAGSNIVYGSRGLWSIALVWWIGHHFKNDESKTSLRILLFRVAGSALILSAIILIFI
ncbi:MAG: EamA family transporter [Methylacidiphilales bacterium]|nr:EamA family transporter [Candidatus Methylacidiphilales bacterium]